MRKREREGGGLSHPIEDFLTDTYSSLDVVSFEVHPPMSLQRRGDYGDKDDALDERESKMERKKKRRKRLHDRARKNRRFRSMLELPLNARIRVSFTYF